MTERHVILTICWPDGHGGLTMSTTERLVTSGGTRRQEYADAMKDARTAVPEGVKPNTLFFSLEPNEAQ